MKNLTSKNATMRSQNESMNVLVNPTVEVVKPSVKRAKNLFSEAKSKTVALYEKVKWLEGSFSEPETSLFKKCLLHTLDEMKDYNEAAFKKDLTMHMAMLLNDRRFDKTCEVSCWSLLKTSQEVAWVSSSVFKSIRDLGISNVKGFNSPGQAVYSYEDLRGDLFSLGFDAEFFKDDRYANLAKENVNEGK